MRRPRARLVQHPPHRLGEGQDEARDLAQLLDQRGAVDRRLAEAGSQRIVVGAEAVELRPELAEMGEIAHPNRAAADLVLIGRADAAAGGADLALARGVLAQRVEIAVEGEDQRAGLGL